MKIKSLFLTALAVLALSACNDDNDVQITPDAGMKGYLNLSIASPKLKTAQTGNDGADDGTESKINNVTFVLTNAGGLITEVVPNVQVPVNTTVTEAKPVSYGTHYVYALVNYQEDEIVIGEHIERVISVADPVKITKGFSGGSFLMVNEFNGSTGFGPKGGVKVTIDENNNTAADAATAEVSVDRVAVKILDNTDYTENPPIITDLNTATNGFVDAVEITGFAILNVNKQFNLVQDWISVSPDKVLKTPLFTTGGNVSTQYFHNIGDYTQLTKDGSGNITGISVKATTSSFSKGIVYATENRPAYSKLNSGGYTAGKGETTGVIYRVVAKKDGNNVGTFYKFGNTISSNWSDIQALSPALFNFTADVSNYPAIRAMGVQVYEGGAMYYTHFIKDPNVNHQLEGKNYYGVFRNSTYDLSVTKLKSLGDDVPGGSIDPVDPDPTNPVGPTNPPIDREETYLEVTIKVNPWVLHKISVEF